MVAGPDRDEAVAYRWALPKPRHARLRDYRIGYVIDDPMCPLDAPVKAVLTDAIAALRKAGARLTEGWPAGVEAERQSLLYRLLLGAFSRNIAMTPAQLETTRENRRRGPTIEWTRGVTSTHVEWLPKNAARLAARAAWQRYFRDHDAFLMPVAYVPAVPHDHSLPVGERKVMTAAGERFYVSLYRWISFATLTGCPATSAPVGLTRDGLPVGLQIMGPYLEDATPIDLAGRIADVTGGFVPPPGL